MSLPNSVSGVATLILAAVPMLALVLIAQAQAITAL